MSNIFWKQLSDPLFYLSVFYSWGNCLEDDWSLKLRFPFFRLQDIWLQHILPFSIYICNQILSILWVITNNFKGQQRHCRQLSLSLFFCRCESFKRKCWPTRLSITCWVWRTAIWSFYFSEHKRRSSFMSVVKPRTRKKALENSFSNRSVVFKAVELKVN